ncbi:EARP-interacting protein homolog [Daktulosphaira vitifoliae]|uniref:EARP-interacting protein homolog n=1 Tax=Daktulosphaira vitifoliae TaxID=58002 RepID=UPI0021A99B96|nr:EARP-interacting protein homolog [Daktulosphaira vitifoliae]
MDQPLIYGVEFQARSLCSQHAEVDQVSFLIGTQSLNTQNNQVHLVKLQENSNTLTSQVYEHNCGEIWSLSASTINKQLISTCYADTEKDCERYSTLWRLPEEDGQLEKVISFPTEKYGMDIKVTSFHPTNESYMASVVDNNVLFWDVDENGVKLVSNVILDGKGQPRFTTGKWNPQSVNLQFVTSDDCNIKAWDLRCQAKIAWSLDGAHNQIIRDFDFNQNRQFYLATCGDDGYSKFWDIRNTNKPIITRSDHSHWIWSIRYNPVHDELVGTASSDGQVLITRLFGISSAALENEEDSIKTSLDDKVIAVCDQHEDSVYCVEWSAANSWILASLSYDGRLLLNKVPKDEQLKILL